MRTVEQIVWDSIGEGGPQLPAHEYLVRIENILENMPVTELLQHISEAIEKRLVGGDRHGE